MAKVSYICGIGRLTVPSLRTTAFFFLLILISLVTRAQESCGTALTRAEHAYEAGAFREVLDILSPCLPEGFAEDDIWRGYRLRAISYLMLDDPDSANIAIGYMLRFIPDYRPVPGVDPYEFIQALGHFTDFPLFGAGVFLDLFASKVQVIQANSLTQSYATDANYGFPIKVNAGAEALYSFSPSVSAGLDLALIYEDISRTSQPLRGLSSQYTESLSSIALPVFVRYRLNTFKVLGTHLQPFFEAGGFGQWITPIAAKVSLTNANGLSTVTPDPDPAGRRNPFNYGWLASAGIIVPLPGAEILLRGRYWNGLADITKPSARYSNALFLPTYYEDDDIALHGFEISVGINLLFGFREYQYEK